MAEQRGRRGPYGKKCTSNDKVNTVPLSIVETLPENIQKHSYPKRKSKQNSDPSSQDLNTNSRQIFNEIDDSQILKNTDKNDCISSTNMQVDEEMTTVNNELIILEELVNSQDFSLKEIDYNDVDTDIQFDDSDLFEAIVIDNLDESDTHLDEHNIEEDEDKIPLYEGANITKGAFMLLLAVLFSQNNIVGKIIEQILIVIGLALPKGHKLCTTLYGFKKYFQNLKNPLIKHFYCSHCLLYLDDSSVIKCPNKMCNKTLSEKGNKSYFLEIPLVSQIRNFFLQNNFYSKLQHRFKRECNNVYSDIYDGQLYNSYCINGGPLSSGDNISFLLNTDGAPVFKSSKVSIWPLYLAINELPYKERFKNENMLLAGLWFGSSKPSMNTFLKPLNKSMKELDQGVLCNCAEKGNFILKAYLLAVTADLPAKCLLCNCVQYNGAYSCWKCTQKGETATVGKGHTHVYPFQHEDPKGPERSRNSVIANSKISVQHANSKPIESEGIKGPSRLLLFPKFDIIKGITIDYMHGVLLGVQKLLIRLWFTANFSGKTFNFRDFVNEVDHRLLQIKPTMAVTRVPRPIESDLKYWKASEYRSFLLFYGIPCTYGILDETRFFHYVNFVSAIHILLKEGCTKEELVKAEFMLVKFVEMFAKLYDKCYMTLNVHQLLHLAECVRDLGPLYTHSCFFFENKNGYMLKLIRSSQNIDNQILNGVSFVQKLPELQQHCIIKGSKEEKVYKSIVQPHFLEKKQKISESAYVLGAMHNEALTKVELLAITNYLGHFPPSDTFLCCHRIILRNMLIYSTNYGRMINRNNATLQLKIKGDTYFGQVIRFVDVLGSFLALVQVLECQNFNSNSHLLKVVKTEAMLACSLDSIVSSCMLIDLSKTTCASLYVCLFPNCLEME